PRPPRGARTRARSGAHPRRAARSVRIVIELECVSEIDTRAAAGRLAALCRPGDVIVLEGPLGAGKTAFTAGLADGLGVEELVVSPSFVLMRRYDSGFLPLVHVDVYRIRSMG